MGDGADEAPRCPGAASVLDRAGRLLCSGVLFGEQVLVPRRALPELSDYRVVFDAAPTVTTTAVPGGPADLPGVTLLHVRGPLPDGVTAPRWNPRPYPSQLPQRTSPQAKPRPGPVQESSTAYVGALSAGTTPAAPGGRRVWLRGERVRLNGPQEEPGQEWEIRIAAGERAAAGQVLVEGAPVVTAQGQLMGMVPGLSSDGGHAALLDTRQPRRGSGPAHSLPPRLMELAGETGATASRAGGGEAARRERKTVAADRSAAAPPPATVSAPDARITASAGGRDGLEEAEASPESRLLPDPEVPEERRWCGRCGESVGRSFDGRPGSTEGYCAQCGTRFSFEPKLAAGDVVAGRYEVLGCLARGGRGWIHLARDKAAGGAYVVLKGLLNTGDADARAAAFNEYGALHAQDHPGIVRFLDFIGHPDDSTGDNVPYIVMDYAPGISLHQLIDRRPSLATVVDAVRQILDVLALMHEQGLLYCDMKPDNVILGDDGRIVVIDFGAVRRIGDRTSPRIGTPGYQVTEAEIEEYGLTVRSDVYTVGRTLQRLLRATSDSAEAAPSGRARSLLMSVLENATCSYEHRYATARDMERHLREVALQLFHDDAPRDLAGRGGAGGEAAESPAGDDSAPAGPGAALRPSALFPPERQRPPFTATDGDDRLADWIGNLLGPGRGGWRPPPLRWAALPEPVPDRGPDGSRYPGPLTDELIAVSRHFRADDLRAVRRTLDRAEQLATGRRGPLWHASWYEGLLRLRYGDPDIARLYLDRAAADAGAETAPRLALALCAEMREQPRAARRHYRWVLARDPSSGPAILGLARTMAAEGRRRPAVNVLDALPAYSRFRPTAEVTALQILSATLPAVRGGVPASPTPEDVGEARERITRLDLPDTARTQLLDALADAPVHAPATSSRTRAFSASTRPRPEDQAAARSDALSGSPRGTSTGPATGATGGGSLSLAPRSDWLTVSQNTALGHEDRAVHAVLTVRRPPASVLRLESGPWEDGLVLRVAPVRSSSVEFVRRIAPEPGEQRPQAPRDGSAGVSSAQACPVDGLREGGVLHFHLCVAVTARELPADKDVQVAVVTLEDRWGTPVCPSQPVVARLCGDPADSAAALPYDVASAAGHRDDLYALVLNAVLTEADGAPERASGLLDAAEALARRLGDRTLALLLHTHRQGLAERAGGRTARGRESGEAVRSEAGDRFSSRYESMPRSLVSRLHLRETTDGFVSAPAHSFSAAAGSHGPESRSLARRHGPGRHQGGHRGPHGPAGHRGAAHGSHCRDCSLPLPEAALFCPFCGRRTDDADPLAGLPGSGSGRMTDPARGTLRPGAVGVRAADLQRDGPPAPGEGSPTAGRARTAEAAGPLAAPRVWSPDERAPEAGLPSVLLFAMEATAGAGTASDPLPDAVPLRVLLDSADATARPMTHRTVLERNRTSGPVAFTVVPRRPGTAVLHFRVYRDRDGQLLQEIRAELPVAGSAENTDGTGRAGTGAGAEDGTGQGGASGARTGTATGRPTPTKTDTGDTTALAGHNSAYPHGAGSVITGSTSGEEASRS